MNSKLRKVNNALTVVVVVLGVYIALMPFYSHFQILIKQAFDDTDGYVYRSALATQVQVDESLLAEPPTGKRLVIPSIQVDEEVLVGSSPSLVHQGLWNRPNASTPDLGGNTVIVGHRFTYANATPAFYHLDKVEVGQRIGLWWDGVEYIYEVREVIVVEANAIEIEGESQQNILTLYTCTPLWTASQRLVVRAILINDAEVGL